MCCDGRGSGHLKSLLEAKHGAGLTGVRGRDSSFTPKIHPKNRSYI